MNERIKMEEAEYFLSKMKRETGNNKNFCFELSAFLSASRFVLQYACKEVQGTCDQHWYDTCISASGAIKFLKDKRDVNIHAIPVEPTAHHKLRLEENIGISDAVNVVLNPDDDKMETSNDSTEETEEEKDTIAPEYSVEYYFSDWKGTEDVLILSEQYLQELKDLVDDGVKNGYISG